ncbi:MAG: DUF4932 domain-containing protein [Paraclostridium sp.]|uniref:DUF4932 domain-containing protein n=1 Tax=Paraclostridium sp. TaxID=2023273 RepID=UPI003F3C909B
MKKIKVSLEVELINIILYTSKHGDICKNIIGFSPIIETNNMYTNEIKNYFGKFKNHKIYNQIEEMTQNGFFLGRPIELALSIDMLNDFKSKYEISNTSVEMSGGQKNIDKLIKLLKRFEKETDFQNFIPKINSYYVPSILKINNHLNKYPFIEATEKFYGSTNINYNFIVSNLSKGNFGIGFKNKNNKIDIYTVFTLDCISKNEDENELNRGALSCNTIFHELSHPIINPITEKNKKLINQYKSAYEYLKTYKTPFSGYADWEECVNEHIIRAFSIMMTRRYRGDYYADKHLKHDYDLGYKYIPNLIDKLQDYEKNRDRYKNIECFYEELILTFSQIL